MMEFENLPTPEDVAKSMYLTVYIWAQYKAYDALLSLDCITEEDRQDVSELRDELMSLLPDSFVSEMLAADFEDLLREGD